MSKGPYDNSPSRQGTVARDIADCVALGVSLDDPLTPAQKHIALRFGYITTDGCLTDSGWEAASDAIGFEDD